MSMLSQLWKKNNVKDRIRARVEAELPKLEVDIARIIFEQSNGKVTLSEAKSASIEVVDILKSIVDKVL